MSTASSNLTYLFDVEKINNQHAIGECGPLTPPRRPAISRQISTTTTSSIIHLTEPKTSIYVPEGSIAAVAGSAVKFLQNNPPEGRGFDVFRRCGVAFRNRKRDLHS